VCIAIVSGPRFLLHFSDSSQDFVDVELEYQASGDYSEDASAHNLRVFDMGSGNENCAVRAGDPANRLFARVTSERRRLHRTRGARLGLVADATRRYITAGHIKEAARPQPAARARVTRLGPTGPEICLPTVGALFTGGRDSD
jgi:hypothetical protein